MTDIAQSIQKATTERDYAASTHILDHALQEDSLPDLIAVLDEMEETTPLITLELRDHVFYYLGMWDIYYAVQISSIDILRLLHEHNVKGEPSIFMIGHIRNLLDTNDSRFSQFCINIETISGGHYAILVPTILDQRMEELANCRIHFTDGYKTFYCTAELLKTYYGGKIVRAIHKNRNFDIVVKPEQFTTIQEGLASAGIDTSSMLERVDPDLWEDFVRDKRGARIEQGGSGELSVLHRVKSARSNIYATVFQQQASALDAIKMAKTQSCNDVLMSVVSDISHRMRRRALHQLGESGDSGTIEFLATVMKNDSIESIRKEAARAYSMLTSRSHLADIGHTIPRRPSKSALLDISKINKILNTLIAKRMPTAMIDDTLSSIVIQTGADSVDILTRLLAKPQTSVKIAVIKASRFLDTGTAAPIIRAALANEDPEIVTIAENELDTRWPDAIWE